MMKRITIAATVLLMAMVMAVSEEKVTLQVFDQADPTSSGYAISKKIWDDFKAQNPDIDLKLEELANESYHQKTAAYIASGQLPDVMLAWPSGRSSELHQKGLLRDLTPLLGKDFLKDFSSVAVNPANQLSGKVSELPRMVTYTHAMWVNKALLDSLGLKVPKTYAELKALTPRLKAKGITPVLMANKDSWVMQSCFFSTIVGRMAGNSWVDSLIAGKAKFTDKEFVSSLQFVATLYKDGIIAKNSVGLSYGEAPGLFASGKAAFMIDGDWRIGDFQTNQSNGVALIPPAKQKSDYLITQFPAIPGEKNPGTVSAILGTGFGISSSVPAGSAKEKAAVRLMKYLYGSEVMSKRLELGFISSRLGVTNDKVEPFTLSMMAYEQGISKTCYVLDGVLPSSVSEVLNTGLQEIGMGVKTPDQVAAALQAEFEKAKK